MCAFYEDSFFKISHGSLGPDRFKLGRRCDHPSCRGKSTAPRGGGRGTVGVGQRDAAGRGRPRLYAQDPCAHGRDFYRHSWGIVAVLQSPRRMADAGRSDPGRKLAFSQRDVHSAKPPRPGNGCGIEGIPDGSSRSDPFDGRGAMEWENPLEWNRIGHRLSGGKRGLSATGGIGSAGRERIRRSGPPGPDRQGSDGGGGTASARRLFEEAVDLAWPPNQ